MEGVVVLCALVVVLLALALARQRALRQRLGTFPCLLIGRSGRQLRGLLVFASTSLYIYRSIWVGTRLVRSYPRGSFEMRNLRLTEQWAQVEIRQGETCEELLFGRDVHSAIVAWIDAAGPREEPIL